MSPIGDHPAGSRVPVLVQQLSYELTRFSHLFAHRHALHPTDIDALAHLHQAALRGEAMTPGRLAASIDLSPPATTALLRRLEASGHVERIPDPADGRRQLLTLTATARQVAGGFFGPLAGALRATLTDLDDAEVAVVERWLASATEATGQLADRVAAQPG
ncbi:MarR family winged helix-turn-helix transcriptional regulator [Nocardioides daeguensis]|uniref:MarR family winged helix-turn-helix transcriptional regulator n=1 Tax=Nocardioides daeguensis TaxID=908359 RepID=A0ABP6VBY3_9ACTN|nr:MarR family winged helix-turn-helix transcriptional regulator [Nocardioides daeguensis]MBV6726259.1 MarR family winged helix-turn-helix transcriptional regulator [Nocardioides daeguensis]MCR1772102.1 MarR family winged helix-turn-helix transcriptional regulator [Nocardioides daeguensis]